MNTIPEKYIKARLPASPDEAIALAVEREEWAAAARKRDQPGSAREWELTAALLRHFAQTFTVSE